MILRPVVRVVKLDESVLRPCPSDQQESGEKLALLQGNLQRQVRVHLEGIDGGESSYRQALLRLKQIYGRRGVMRSSLRTKIKELVVPQNDPIGFERFANQPRNYLFDLSRVGETGLEDVIDGLCSRLKLDDRLAWYLERWVLALQGRVDLNAF